MTLREDLRKWAQEHPVAAGLAIVATAAILVYAYEMWRWRLVRPRY